VLAHETGHNLNCDHDRANEFGSPCNDDGHSFGHRFVGDSDEEFRTIMSYQPGTRIPHFSNPSVSYDGQPTGVPLSSQDPCHNSLSITDRRDTVEEYRLTRFDIWVDFDVGVYQEGTYHYPYATLAAAVTEIDAGINATESPTMWIKTGTTDETVTINERMIIRACDDSVVIGVQP
jgi:hypothetical protein